MPDDKEIQPGTGTPTRRKRRYTILLGVILLGVVVAAAFVIRYGNVDAVERLTEQRLSQLVGREVTIAGGFAFTYSLTPVVAAQKLSIANAGWGAQSDMLVAEELEVELEILPLLLRGDVEIDRFVLAQAEIFVERGPDGQFNWQLDVPAEGGDSGQTRAGAGQGGEQELAVRALSVIDSTVVWRGEGGESETVALERLSWQSSERGDTLTFEASGRYGEDKFVANGTLGKIQDLFSAQASPIDLMAAFGATQMTAAGQMGFPLAGSRTELSLTLKGEDDALLGAVFGRRLKQLGAWQLSSEIGAGEDGLQASAVNAHVNLPGQLSLSVAGGSVDRLLEGRGLKLPASAEAPSLAGIEALAGGQFPELGGFRAEGRLVGSIENLSLEQAVGWFGPTEDAPLLRVAGGRVDNVIDGSGFDLRLEMESGGAALAALPGRLAALDSLTASSRLTGDIGALALQDLQADASLNGAEFTISGDIMDLAGPGGLDLRVSSQGSELAAFAPLLGFGLPEDLPFRLSSHITGSWPALALQDLSGRFAESEVQGRLLAELPEAEVPRLQGELALDRLVVDAVWPASAHVVEAGTGLPPEQAQLDLPFLEQLEAALTLRAGTVIAEGRQFRNVSARLRLQDGMLSIDDLTAQVAGGSVEGGVVLDAAAENVAEIVVNLQAEEIEVSQLIGGMPGRVKGRLDVNVNVDTAGRTLDQLAENLEGEAAVFGEEGELQDVPLNRMIPDLDITRILPFFRSRDTAVRVNCLIGEFDIANGVARTDSMLDTRRMTLLGEGAVDLGAGTLDLKLRPIGKSRKLSSSSVPVDIEGSLRNPQIRPSVGEAAGGALRGFLGGLLIPLNQLSALFGDDARDACAEALQQARENQEQAGDDDG